MACLKQTRLPSTSEIREKSAYEDIFNTFLKDQDLWLLLLSNSKPSEKVQKDPQFVIVYQAVSSFLSAADTKKLRIGFLVDLKGKETAVRLLTKLCVFFQSCNNKERARAHLNEDDVHSLIKSNFEEVNRLHGVLTDLEKAVKFLQSLQEVIVDVGEVVELITEKKKGIKDILVEDTLDEKFWGSFDVLVQNVECLSEHFQSLVFLAAAKSCFYEIQFELSDDEEETGELNAEEALEILSDEGLQKFGEFCRPLFDDLGSLPLSYTERLLDTLKTENELDKELSYIGQQFESVVPDDVKEMLKCYMKYPTIRKNVQKLDAMLRAFGFEGWQENDWTLEVAELSQNFSNLKAFSDFVKSFDHINAKLDENLMSIVLELAQSHDLVDLLIETANDDVVVFIDAVEEHSDQTVSESDVSDFIEVHRFISPVVQDLPDDPKEFFDNLHRRYVSLEKLKTGMAAKIKVCSCSVHSLKNLYNNLANRGEMTKEIIANALSKGFYNIEGGTDTQVFGGSNWQFKLTYDTKYEVNRTYNMGELLDFRSRALLIMNSETKQQSLEAAGIARESSNVDFQEFVKQVDFLSEITRFGEELQSSGHPKFDSYFQKLNGTSEIVSLSERLQKELQKWDELLEKVRNKHFYLNYFHPVQLWTLEKFSHGDDSVEKVAHSLFRFINPTVSIDDLQNFNFYEAKTGSNVEARLEKLGVALDEKCKEIASALDGDADRSPLTGSPIKPRQVYVAVLDENSTQTVPVVMKLFYNRPGWFPQPNQILFCQTETTWDEINLLLRRCFFSHAHGKVNNLHCLANVESLPYNLQFQLVDAIKRYHSDSDAPYLLTLICRGGEHHPIANEFPNSDGRLAGMTDAELRHHFGDLFPSVTMVTSNIPGLGKTEMIYEKAAQSEKTVMTFSISGPLSRRQLVERLISLDLKSYHCLHLDISEVNDPLFLDTFLFELIVVGMVASETQLFHIPTRFIFVEIANTLQHWLRDSLTVTKCFNRLHSKWNGYKQIVSSCERASQMQIVCQYLEAYDNKTLESDALSLQQLNERPLLSENKCRYLLEKYFSFSTIDLSFNILDSFISVLADQLRKFSSSPFFRPKHLKDMIDKTHDIRTRLFEALLDVSKEFASRSVEACKAVQAKALDDRSESDFHTRNRETQCGSAVEMVNRLKGMVQWAESNHLVVMFHTLDASVTALFRELDKVPVKVCKCFHIFNSKHGK